MMEIRLKFLFLLSCFFSLSSIHRSLSLASIQNLGIAPQDEGYYKGLSSGAVKCKDGSKKFTKDQLNDDFCDCPDGSDEPGTSACSSGKFYCKNAGHVPLIIYSSRVNDGICDCCDGSDEYDGKVKCPNTCWEVGKVARDKLKKKIATYQEGATLRKKEVEEAKLAIAKEEAELSKLKAEANILKGRVEQLKEQKEQIEKAEEKERLKKEQEEKDKKEADDAKQGVNKEEKTEIQEEAAKSDVHDKIGLLEESPSEQDVVESHDKNIDEVEHGDHSVKDDLPADEVEQIPEDSSEHPEMEESSTDNDVSSTNEEKDATENTESLSKEELGRVIGSRWLGKKSEQETKEGGAGTDTNHDELPSDTHEEDDGFESEVDEHKYDDDDGDEHKYDESDGENQDEDFGGQDHDSGSSYTPDSNDDSDFSDFTTSSSLSWMEKMQQTVKSIFRAVNFFQTPVNISDADSIRKAYDESNNKLTKIQSRISSLKEKLKQDFGPEKEFYSFYGQCFESKENKYTYKICPFKQASQVEGYSTTRLGNWDKFEDSYKAMQFSGGDHCWNGPDRSLKVKLRCGLKNELTDVDEPSRCEYLAFLATPALCVEEKLKELQDKLEVLNREQPQGHDEL